MAILKFRKLTRAQFDTLSTHDPNIRYTVEEPDNTLVDYIGDRPVLSEGGSVNSEQIKTLYESNPDTNVFDDATKDKLEDIENGAQVNVKSDWDATTGDAEILNKPTPDQFLGVSDIGYIKRIDENTFEIDGNTYVTEGSFNLQLLEKQNNKPDGTNQLVINGKLNSVYMDSLYASDIVEVDTLDEMLLLEDMKRGDIVIVRNVETTYILKQEPSDDVDNWASFLVQPAVVSVNGKVGVVQIGISDIENLQGILNSKLNISVFEDELIILNNELNTKVDKVAGKGLSANDFTDVSREKLISVQYGAQVNPTPAEIKVQYESNADTNAFTNTLKGKLEGIEEGAQVNTVKSVSGRIGDVVLDKGDVGLGNVENIAPLNMPISNATNTKFDTKLDKIWTDITEQTSTLLTDLLVINRGTVAYKATLGNLLSNITTVELFEVVTVLPASGVPNKIYLVTKNTPEGNDGFDEYAWIDGDWELLGALNIDLSNYYPREEADIKFGNKISIPQYTVPYRTAADNGEANASLSVTDTADAETIAKRYTDGRLKVGDAVDPLDAVNQGLVDSTLVKLTDPRLTDARNPLAHTHPMSDVIGLESQFGNTYGNNIAMLDLSTATDLGDGNYRVYDADGITVDYNVNSGIRTINGTWTSATGTAIIPLSNVNGLTLTVSVEIVSGVLPVGTYYRPSGLIDYQMGAFEGFAYEVPYTRNDDFIRVANGAEFNNFQYKLQLEQGDTPTPYTVPLPFTRKEFDDKLNKVTTGGKRQVYGINPSNTQEMIEAINTSKEHTIPYRDADGNFEIGNATTDAHAINRITADARYAPIVHTHSISQITNLEATLDGKAPTSHTHTWGQITNTPNTVAGYGITDAFTKTETNTLLNNKVDKVAGKGLSTNDLDNTRLAQLNKVATIETYIPAETNATNNLADKQFVIDSVQSLAARYVTYDAAGAPFPSKAALMSATDFYYQGVIVSGLLPGDNTLVTTDEDNDNLQSSYFYDGASWLFRYTIGSAFTVAQQSAIDSGITSAKVSTYDGYASEIAGKATKIEIAQNRVPARITTGIGEVDGSLPISSQNTNNTIAYRTATGTLRASNATDSTDLVPLGQVTAMIDDMFNIEIWESGD